MDFSQQIVSSWAQQDKAIAKRSQRQQVQAAMASSANSNGYQVMTLSSGAKAYGPTNSNADVTGQPVRYGAGLALSRVASV
jgi:hypothetical protein